MNDDFLGNRIPHPQQSRVTVRQAVTCMTLVCELPVIDSRSVDATIYLHYQYADTDGVLSSLRQYLAVEASW